jgi:hypothetical protein
VRDWEVSGLETQLDLASAVWLKSRFAPLRLGIVGSASPSGYEAYVRILFPFTRLGLDSVKWSEIAHERPLVERTMSVVEAVMRMEIPRVGDHRVFETRQLPDLQLASLTETLRAATRTPSATWIALWEGYGDLGIGWHIAEEPPRFSIDQVSRGYLLYRGSIEAGTLLQGQRGYLPSIWWPEGREWVFTTDTDLAFAFVACEAVVADLLVTSSLLEAHRTQWHADLLK